MPNQPHSLFGIIKYIRYMNPERLLVFTLSFVGIFVGRVHKGSHFNCTNRNVGITVTKLN